MGASTTPDFAGWHEIDNSDLTDLLANSPIPADATPPPGRREVTPRTSSRPRWGEKATRP